MLNKNLSPKIIIVELVSCECLYGWILEENTRVKSYTILWCIDWGHIFFVAIQAVADAIVPRSYMYAKPEKTEDFCLCICTVTRDSMEENWEIR